MPPPPAAGAWLKPTAAGPQRGRLHLQGNRIIATDTKAGGLPGGRPVYDISELIMRSLEKLYITSCRYRPVQRNAFGEQGKASSIGTRYIAS
jgi:hypothetical protein